MLDRLMDCRLFVSGGGRSKQAKVVEVTSLQPPPPAILSPATPSTKVQSVKRLDSQKRLMATISNIFNDLKIKTKSTLYLHSSYVNENMHRFRPLHCNNNDSQHQMQLLIASIVLFLVSTVNDCAPVATKPMPSLIINIGDSNQSKNNTTNNVLLAEDKKVTISAQRNDSSSSSSGSSNNSSSSGSNNSNMKEINALTYLQKFGYMSETFSTTANLVTELSFQSAIKSFQRFAGLNETGLIDNRTEYFMRIPRCGNKDLPMSMMAANSQNKLVHHSFSLGDISHHLQLNQHSTAAAATTTTGRNRSRRNFGSIRKKRYALQGSKWRRQELTYRISQYPTRYLNRRDDVDQQIAMAFGVWSQVAPIDFIVKRDGRVHIDIRFASGDHGDGDAFDGPGNTLAHAYFPQYGGDAHFDDQEYWTIDSYAGTNIFQVAAHELGHSLGLGHSSVREALMAPFYQKYKPNFKIHDDDIMAIQALYGVKLQAHSDSTAFYHTTDALSSTTTTTTTTTSSTTKRPVSADRRHETNDKDDEMATNNNNNSGDTTGNNHESDDDQDDLDRPQLNICTDSRIDAITRTQDGQSYVFKGEYYWLLTSDGVAKKYPRHISTDWEGLPGNLNAALTWADGKTFFFKGNKYWRFRNRKRDSGYPKLISTGFAGIPDDIDAAFVWSGNGRTYIFKGAQYWRFDSKSEPPVSSEYPRSIKIWSGIPYNIDAAFKWDNNITYFFKGNQYYRFNDGEFKVEPRGRPQFPRSTGEWWFGCTASNLAQKRLPFNGGVDGLPFALEHEFQREPLSPSFATQDDNDNLDMNVRNEMIETDDTNSLWSLHSSDSDVGPKIYGTHINDGTMNNDIGGLNTKIVTSTERSSTNNHYYFSQSSSPSSSLPSFGAPQYILIGGGVDHYACLIFSMMISVKIIIMALNT